MENSMSRILIGSVVKKALKDIQESPERSIRNLVDMALQFSEGRFQQHFFATAQTMLQNENSGFYGLVRDTVACADTDRLYTFGMNLGYNGCTAGAQRIRENEKKLGCNIPWTLALQINPQRLEENEPRYHGLIQEGETLGICTWMLFAKSDPQYLLSMIGQHPDSAFILFCEAANVTSAFLDYAADVKNLMLAVRYDENATDVYEIIRSQGLLCSVWYPYGQKDVETIMSGDLFTSVQEVAPIFTILVQEPDCPEEAQRLAYQAVERVRTEQTYRTILWEMQGDTRKVDAIISEDDCFAYFDENGFLREWNKGAKDAPNNLFETSLTDIFSSAFPKK